MIVMGTMGIFSKIKNTTKSSHFSICQIEEGEIAIDLWDLNQTYKIDLNSNQIYFDTEHSDYNTKNLNEVKEFLEFLKEHKDEII